jgi:hypothetical protein
MKRVNRAQIVALAAAAFGVAVSSCGSDAKKPAASANEVSSTGSAVPEKEPKEHPMKEASCGNHP